MRKFLLISVATPFLALFAHGQQLPMQFPGMGDDSSITQGQSASCSDPTMASSPQCMRGQGGMQIPFGSLGSTSSETVSSQPGRVPTFTDEYNRGNTSQRPGYIELPPEPLTEFQKFVASTSGQILPVYGANLFRNVPSTFTPLENTPVPSDYVLGPEDEVRVRVWGQVNFNANVHVDRAGDIFLPQIGTVHVAGLRFDELQQHLHDAISRVYRNFQLIAELGQIRSIQVYLTGEARRPGVYTISSLSSLIDALFASGGPSVQGSMRRIELRRSGEHVTTLDLYRVLIEGDKTQDAKLLSGDVIYIPPVGEQVAIIGSVRRPSIYELLPNESVSAALRDAGGATSLASDARASIDRNMEHSNRQTMEVRLDAAGMNTPLQDGDILHVLSLVSKYDKTVTLRGNTANPGRFAWHDGMRLSDLIPDRDALITRDYWWKRAQLGLPASEFQPISALSAYRQPEHPIDLRRPTNPSRQQQQQQTPANQQQGNASQQQQQQPVSSEDPYQEFATGTTAATTNPNGTQAAETQTDNRTRASGTALAEQDTETAESLAPPRAPRTVVRLSAPEIDWSYAVIERMDPTTLKTQLLPFDLGKLVNDHDPTQDLALQPGDVVTVFSQNDIHVPIAEQTTLVRLEGEFVHAGTYTVHPGETLRDLVQRAGGLTPNAYLYGSVFTRESTRVLQQRRIDEAIHEMTLQMQRGNLALAANPASNAQDLASISAAQSSERELVAQLQQVRANGRIVFQFKPDSQGVDIVPAIKLENGDDFLIPSVPSTVNVLGAVFNQNSFVYRPGAQVRSFLDLAGGPNVNADRHRMFVIRANGAVLSRTVVKGTWGNDFFHLRLYPGDTIIVPEKTIKPSALRGVLDWTQIFSQLAFGAAAINVLR